MIGAIIFILANRMRATETHFRVARFPWDNFEITFQRCELRARRIAKLTTLPARAAHANVYHRGPSVARGNPQEWHHAPTHIRISFSKGIIATHRGLLHSVISGSIHTQNINSGGANGSTNAGYAHGCSGVHPHTRHFPERNSPASSCAIANSISNFGVFIGSP